MAWDDAPPTADELAKVGAKPKWDATPPTEEELNPQPNILLQGAKLAGKAAGTGLDYLSGLTRTALAKATGVLQPGEATPAFEGSAVPMNEIMKRYGVPESTPVNVPSSFAGPFGGTYNVPVRTPVSLAASMATDPLSYASFGLGPLSKLGRAGELAETAITPLQSFAESAGPKIYRSGLKRIDQEAAKYGKEPVSDLLFQKNIRGSAKSIQNKMDKLSENLLQERNDILARATQAGGEASMANAMAPVFAETAKIKQSEDPALQGLARYFEKKAGSYLNLDAQPEQQITRTLPTSRFVPEYREVKGFTQPTEMLGELPTGTDLNFKNPQQALEYQPPGKQTTFEQIPGSVQYGNVVPSHYEPGPEQTVMDIQPATKGPTPTQASGFKTSVSSLLPKSAQGNYALSSKAQQLQKTMAGGLQKETENAVGKALGPEEAQRFHQTNADLGKILTTREKQELEANKELNKNNFSSVDAALVGLGLKSPHHAAIGIAKKIGDIGKLTNTRTTLGLGLARGAQLPQAPLADILVRRALLNQFSPWQQLPQGGQ